jgi:AmmeMemoRadiSam system protein B/AmmeMemoRadiSam system protein A
MSIKQSQCAGDWFPKDSKQLSSLIRQWIDLPPKIEERPMAVVVPHAGYAYSGPTAATAYQNLTPHSYDRVFLIYVPHFLGYPHGLVLPNYLAYQTPLGLIDIDVEYVKKIGRLPFCHVDNAQNSEHAIECQLPFLQSVLSDFRLIPMGFVALSPNQRYQLTNFLLNNWTENDLLVITSDFTHYGPNYDYIPFDASQAESELHNRCSKMKKLVETMDEEQFRFECREDTVCGQEAIGFLLGFLNQIGNVSSKQTGSDFSGRLQQDWTNSVTYQSFVFFRRNKLNGAEREYLLRLVRLTVLAHLLGKPIPEPDYLPSSLLKKSSCFVSIGVHGQLRGCMGNVTKKFELYKAVISNTLAACEDPRFQNVPLDLATFYKDFRVEISLLHSFEETESFDIGRHGIIVSHNNSVGLLLPQVARRHRMTHDEFMQSACSKAGINNQRNINVTRFEADTFGQPIV